MLAGGLLETPAKVVKDHPTGWSKTTQKASEEYQKGAFGVEYLKSSKANQTKVNFSATDPRQSRQADPKRPPKKLPGDASSRFKTLRKRCQDVPWKRGLVKLDFLRMYCTESKVLEVWRWPHSHPKTTKSVL